MAKNLPANAEDTGSIPGLERSPAGGNSNPLQYSCLENLLDGGPRGLQTDMTEQGCTGVYLFSYLFLAVLS